MKKYLKIGAIVLGFTIIFGIIYVANSFTGNPISKQLVNSNVKVYVEQTYPELDLVIDDAFYDFKNGFRYIVSISSEHSEDLYFNILYNMKGEIVVDGYDSSITEGNNVMWRLSLEYKDETNRVFDILETNELFQGAESFYFSGWLQTTADIEYANTYHNWGLTGGVDTTTLILDQQYDVGELGADSGLLDLYVDFADGDTSFERGALALKETKRVFDEQEIHFKHIRFGVFNQEGNLAYGVDYFPYDEIDSDDLAEKLEQLHNEYGVPEK